VSSGGCGSILLRIRALDKRGWGVGKRTTYKVPLNGRDNVRKWITEIGFSNPYKMDRAINALKK